MKLILKISLACLLATGCASKNFRPNLRQTQRTLCARGRSQSGRRIHDLPKSTFQTEIVVSPWKSINNHHALFCIFMGEYRRYFKEHNRGWYLGANIGMQAFDLSKPYIENWKLKFENRYSKGYGFMIGLCVGYEHIFRERWVLDAYFGWSWMSSFYNGYSMDGKIDMNPGHRGRTQIPRSVQRFVGVVSQQDRIVDRIPYFQSAQEKIVRQQLVLPPRSPTDSNHPPHGHRFRIVIFQPYP